MSLPESLTRRLRLPVMCAPLFIISNPKLVIAQCTAGVVGSFPSLNARPLSQLDEWLHEITEALHAWDRDHPDRPSAPFAVNQIVHRTNDRLDQDIELCVKHKAPLIITSLGARPDVNEALHAYGATVFHDVINDRFARKAVEKGADGLITVAAGAGGHAGTLSPFALVQEIREWFDGPLALSGAIASGRSILAAQAMGADLAYIGSMFIAAEEANAQPLQKQMVVDGRADDIVYSNLFTGVHGNYLRPSIVKAGLDPDDLAISDASKMNFGSGGNTKAKAWKDIWGCGQGISPVKSIGSAAGQIARLAAEYDAARRDLDARPAAGRTPYVVSGDRWQTGGEVNARAARAAAGFRALGVGEGDTVALFLRNDFAFLEASVGANLTGAYPVPMNWHATASEAGYILRDCSAKALVIHEDLVEHIRFGIPESLPVLVVTTPPEVAKSYGAPTRGARRASDLDWEGWIGSHAPLDKPSTVARAAVLYTSGTTGVPKGVRRAPADSSQPSPAMSAFGLDTHLPATVLMNGPMYHAAPNGYALASLASGADIVLQPKFDAEEMLALIQRFGVTHMHIVPTMFVRLLQLPEATRRRYDLRSLRFVIHGAAPCPPDVKRRMIEWWGPVIHEYYGASEFGLVTRHDSEESLRKPGTVGRALPNTIIKVLDDEGRELGPGEIGEVYAHRLGAADFDYIGLSEKRAEVGRGDLVTVGDVGWLDEEGFLFLCDRKRDMIISGGVNIYPAEIEAQLIGLSGVRDCAVFGIPDDEFGELVCAYVELAEGETADEETLCAQLAVKLSRYKIPRRFKFVSDLPREDSGKIFKRKLRDPYWAGRARPI